MYNEFKEEKIQGGLCAPDIFIQEVLFEGCHVLALYRDLASSMHKARVDACLQNVCRVVEEGLLIIKWHPKNG